MRKRRIRLAPDRMTDAALWELVASSLRALDPLDFHYQAGQTHHVSLNAQDALRELRLRGVQLALPLSEGDDRPNQVA